MANEIRGVVTVAGQKFYMSAERGYGVVRLDDKLTLIRFSTPFESNPPQGSGEILGQSFTLEVKNGQLQFDGFPLATEVEANRD